MDALPKWVCYINNFDEIIQNLILMYFHYFSRDHLCSSCVERDSNTVHMKKSTKLTASKSECNFCLISKQPFELKKKLKNLLVRFVENILNLFVYIFWRDFELIFFFCFRSIIELGFKFMKLFINYLKREVSRSGVHIDLVLCILEIVKKMITPQYKRDLVQTGVIHFLIDIVVKLVKKR